MGIFSFISAIFKPAAELIENLHTSDEEKLKVQSEIKKIENELLGKVVEYEKQLMEHKATIITAEATGHSWLQRNWRPITMLTFLALVVLDAMGLLAYEKGLPKEAWTLLQIGLGGYVIGRSAEKVTKELKNKSGTIISAKGVAKG